ncbi:MAG: hypothetical protein KF876_08710 [Nitrospira sp.]|nr:hypothetical protein [Nitrospira sp.]
MATSGLEHKEFIGQEGLVKSGPCSRCQGLMVIEQGFDSLTGSGPANISLRRCVQCGEVIDPVILQNRRVQNGRALPQT